jgi:superfamily II DNA/RNA helicase
MLARDGIKEPFPIQSATLPDSLQGRDVLGRGRTGSGKTLAFGLAVLTRLSDERRDRKPGRPRALILAPTRELALQIDATIAPLARELGLRTTTIFGGVGQNPQVNALRNGVDVVVACPGRLEDLITQGHVKLDRVEITVLDEADHMADLGFLPGVKRLLDRTPDDGQRLLFSATLDNGIDVIVKRYLTNPVTHSVDSVESPVSTMTHHVFHVTQNDRLPVLADLTSAPGRTIVFTRTKHRAKQLTRQLNAHGITTVEMHGNLSQNVRTRNLAAFSEGRAAAMVATDIAARGIHVDDIALVIHADPPIEHKAYLHRSGRTARAGNEGTVVTLVTESQRKEVSQLMQKAKIKPIITVVTPESAILAEIKPGQRMRRSALEVEKALAIAEEPPRGGHPGRGSRSKPRSLDGRGDDRTGDGRPGRSRNSSARGRSAPAKSTAKPGQRAGAASRSGSGAGGGAGSGAAAGKGRSGPKAAGSGRGSQGGTGSGRGGAGGSTARRGTGTRTSR